MRASSTSRTASRRLRIGSGTGPLSGLAAVASAAAGWWFATGAHAAVVDVTWIGPSGGTWNTITNWSPNVLPNNGADTYNVFIDAGNAANNTVVIPTGFTRTIDTLTLSLGDQLDVINNSFLILNGTGGSATLNNAGIVRVLGTLNDTRLQFGAGTTSTISGGGTIVLQNTGRMFGATGSRIININNVIEGDGTISVNVNAFTNQAGGVIRANVAGKPLMLDPQNVVDGFVNLGRLEAANGGTLILTGIGAGSFNNAGGTISAAAGSEVRLQTNAAVTGGTLLTTGGGVLRNLAGQTATLTDVTVAGFFLGENQSTTNVNGTVTNTGSINIQASTVATNLVVQTDTSLTGGGAVNLVDTDNAINNQAGISGAAGLQRLTNVDNVIQGHGAFGQNSIAVTNQAAGLVHANVPGGTMTVDPGNFVNAFVNNGVMRASNGGLMILTGSGNGTFINNNLIEALAGSEVRLLTFAEVIGGTFSSSGTGVVRVPTGQNIFFTNIANNGTMVSDNNTDFGVTGSVHNRGTISIQGTVSATDIELQADTSFTGGGTVTLADLDTAVSSNQAGINGAAGALRLTNVDNVIQGSGLFGQNSIAITNQAGGLIHANVPTSSLTLDPVNVTNSLVNNGTMRASNGGALVLTGSGNGTFINNSVIEALNGSDVRLITFANVIGGTFTSSGTGAVRVPTGENVFFTDIANNGTMVSANNTDFGTSGTLRNAGTILIQATATATDIELQVDTTVSGGGTIILADSDSGTANQAGINAAGNRARLTNVDNVIQGHGAFGQSSAAFTNGPAGVIDANVPGGTMTVDPANVANAFVNNGTLRSSNGAHLVLSGSGNGTFSGTGSIVVTGNASLTTTTTAVVVNGPVTLDGTWNNLSSSTVTVARVRGSGTLGISSGSVTIAANGGDAGTSRVGTLSLSGTGRLDLKDNDLVLDYDGGSPVVAVRTLLRTGYATGAWNGVGINSSAAAAVVGPKTALGYRDNATSPVSTFSGQVVDASSVLIKYTYGGDADMDGDCDGADIATWAQNFTGSLAVGTGTKFWSNGDWDYDSDVDGADAALSAQSFTGSLAPGTGLGAVVAYLPEPVSPGALAVLEGLGVTVVPEPGLLGVISLGAWSLSRRCRPSGRPRSRSRG